MPDKYIKQVNGVLTEQSASDTTAGAADAGKIIALDSSGKLPTSMLPSGLGLVTYDIEASENLSAGDFVNIHVSTGTRVRRASAADATKPAHGFVLASALAGQTATVYTDSTNTAVSGKVAGTTQYLSAVTPGATTSTAPTTAGQIVQRLGVAFSPTSIDVEVSQNWIVLA